MPLASILGRLRLLLRGCGCSVVAIVDVTMTLASWLELLGLLLGVVGVWLFQVVSVLWLMVWPLVALATK